MSRFSLLRTILITTPLALVASFQAYLDPGSGSFVIQLIIGTIVGAFVVLKVYWNRIRNFFASTSSDDADNAGSTQTSVRDDSPLDAS